jgi:RNA polymerase sigma factor (sigma-70 family)
MKDYRIKITIRNDRLLNAIEDKGIPSVKQFCTLYQLNYNSIVKIISGKIKPLNNLGKPIRLVEQIIDILDISLEDAFTERQLKGFAKTNYEISVAEKELKQLVNPVKNQEQKIIEQDVKLKILEAFSKRLSPREEKLIRLKYGFGDEKEHTLYELSSKFRISVERVRQIISKAQRKMKHPSVSRDIINTGFNEIYTSVDISKKLIKQAERMADE